MIIDEQKQSQDDEEQITTVGVRYEWKEAVKGRYKFGPDVAMTEFERIISRDGELDAEIVVYESEPATAPLHSAFEWDDSVAAHRYRTNQAEGLIRSVLVITTSSNGDETTATRALVSRYSLGRPDDPESEEPTVHRYIPLNDVLESADLLQAYLERSLEDLRAYTAKHAVLRTFTDINAMLANLYTAIEKCLVEQ